MKTFKKLFPLVLLIGVITGKFIFSEESSSFPCEKGVKITIERPFKEPLEYGVIPMKVEILNPFTNENQWKLDFGVTRRGVNSFESRNITEFSVPPLQTRTKVIWVPVSRPEDKYGLDQYQFNAQGPGVDEALNEGHKSRSNNDKKKTVGLWVTKEDIVWKEIKDITNDETKTESSGDVIYEGLCFGSAWLPADWRTFSGLSILWVDTKDWAELAPEMREAMERWVWMGGELHLLKVESSMTKTLGLEKIYGEIKNEDEAFNFEKFKETKALGLGKVYGETVTVGESINFEKFSKANQKSKNLPLYPPQYKFTKEWFTEMSGELEKFYLGILIFAIIFMLTVGPVNLYRWAPLNQRGRLFVTVPLISILSVGILFVMIYLYDGFGGAGKRNVLAYLAPEENRVGILQEQVAKTGLLWNRRFELAEEALLRKVERESEGVLEKDLEMIRQNDKMMGDWFLSRDQSGHQIRAYLPTRARFEMKEGQSPRFISSIQDRLEWAYWIDHEGDYWKTEGWEPGQEREMIKSSREEFETLVKKGITENRESDYFKEAMRRVFEKRNVLIAKGGGSEGIPIPTLKTVQWNDDLVYYVQEVKP